MKSQFGIMFVCLFFKLCLLDQIVFSFNFFYLVIYRKDFNLICVVVFNTSYWIACVDNVFWYMSLGFNTGSRPNPLVMSELRRQREMFEQNKKLKFVEKQRRKRDSADDNRSDGGTYSIRSDLDEGVGHSMFSADVTTAATWGGSTEQSSSSEEDSAVGEEDFPEEVIASILISIL